MKNKIEYLIKHNSFFQFIYKITFSSIFKLVGFFIKVDKKTILFTGHGGKINDSPFYIYLRMKKDPYFADYNLVWGVKDLTQYLDEDYKVVKIDSLKYFFISMQSYIWVASVNIERGLNYKKNSTFYINTWHGVPLKTIGNSAPGRKDYDFSNIDSFIISGEYEREIYVRDFKIKKENIFKIGLPRNEILYSKVDSSIISKIKSKIGIRDLDKKVILYAPTWRESNDSGKSFLLKPPIDFDLWQEKLSNEYIVLLRLHPYTTKILGVQFDDFIVDCSSWNNVNELIFISDILITDYSSIMFDFSITRKPFLCFAYDYYDYVSHRGIYFDFKQRYPMLYSDNQNDLINKIENMDYNNVNNVINKFKEKFIETGENSINSTIEIIKSKTKYLSGGRE